MPMGVARLWFICSHHIGCSNDLCVNCDFTEKHVARFLTFP